MRRRLGVILLGLFVLLASCYSLVVPPWEAPDEVDHFRYAQFLLVRNRLPLQSLAASAQDVGTAHHPPLFYALAAALIAPFEVGDLNRVARPNGAFVWGEPNAGGHHVFLHDSAAEQFPFSDGIRALHLGRMVPVAAGATTVLATWALASLLVGPRSMLPLAAMALVAFLPSFLFTSATLHNDGLVTALGAMGLWRLFAFTRRPTRANIAVAVALFGLATLAKASGLLLVALVPLAVFLDWLKRRRTGEAATFFIIGLAVYLGIAGWWLLRNQLLYGDPVGWGLFSSNPSFPIQQQTITPDSVLHQVGAMLPPHSLLWHTFVLAFGYMDQYGPRWIYEAAYAAAAVAALGLGLAAVRSVRRWRAWLGDAVLGLAAVGLLAAGVVRYSLSFAGGDHGRYLFPVLPVIAIGVALGWRAILPGPIRALTAALLCSTLLALAVLTPPLIIMPRYALSGRLAAPEASSLVANREATFGDLVQLARADLASDRARPGEHLTLRLIWRALADVPQSYRLSVQLLAGSGTYAGGIDRVPGEGDSSTALWRRGDTIADSSRVPIRGDAPPGLYRVAAALYRYPEMDRLSVAGPDAGPEETATLGYVKVLPLLTSTPAQPLVVFGEEISLLQAAVAAHSASAGSSLSMALLWRAEHRPGADYTASLQLFGPAGSMVAQADGPPVQGRLPTSLWEPGDVIPDLIDVVLPPQTPASLRVMLVLYDRATGRRLPVPGGDAYELGVVSVGSP